MGVLRVRHFQWLSQDSKPYSCACIILKPSTAVWALNLNLKSTCRVFRQNNSQTLSSLSGFVDMHNRNSGTLSNALVLLAKHAIPPNPHALFWSQRRYFFLATKSQSTRQIFFSNGGTTCVWPFGAFRSAPDRSERISADSDQSENSQNFLDAIPPF